jgi:hypothetical protein
VVVVDFSASYARSSARIEGVRFSAPPVLHSVSVTETVIADPSSSPAVRSFAATVSASAASGDALPLRVAYTLIESSPSAAPRAYPATTSDSGVDEQVALSAPRTRSFVVMATVTDAFGSSVSCRLPAAAATATTTTTTVEMSLLTATTTAAAIAPGTSGGLEEETEDVLCPFVDEVHWPDTEDIVDDVFRLVSLVSGGNASDIDTTGQVAAAFCAGSDALALALKMLLASNNESDAYNRSAGVALVEEQVGALLEAFLAYVEAKQADWATDMTGHNNGAEQAVILAQNVVVRSDACGCLWMPAQSFRILDVMPGNSTWISSAVRIARSVFLFDEVWRDYAIRALLFGRCWRQFWM